MSRHQFVSNQSRPLQIIVAVIGLSVPATGAFAQSTTVPITSATRSISTAAQSETQAFADLLRGKAQARLLAAQAASEQEEYRRKAIENQLFKAETRRAIRDLADEQTEILAARRAARRARQLEHAPLRDSHRPSADQLNPTTGEISWPLILATDEFTEAREEIAQVFRDRAVHGSIEPERYVPLKDLIYETQAELKRKALKYTTTDYIAGSSLLRKLAFESRLPAEHADGERLAVR